MPVRYKVDRRTNLSAAEISALSATSVGREEVVDAIVVTGSCPTCEHPVVDTLAVTVVDVDVLSPTGTDGIPEASVDQARIGQLQLEIPPEWDTARMVRRPFVMRCRCAFEHDGRPEEASFGCGRSWMIDIKFAPSLPGQGLEVLAPSPESLARWFLLEQEFESSSAELPAVRAAADKWQKALAGILATVTLTSLIGGRDALLKIAETHREVVTSGWALATILGVVSTWKAHRASIGQPKLRFRNDGGDLLNIALEPGARAMAAVRDLRSAARWALLALMAALATVSVLWLAPKADQSRNALARVTFDDDTQACGELLSSTSDRAFRVRLSDGSITSAPAEDVRGLVFVEGCE